MKKILQRLQSWMLHCVAFARFYVAPKLPDAAKHKHMFSGITETLTPLCGVFFFIYVSFF